MLFGTSNFGRQTIINNTIALAKASVVFDVAMGARIIAVKRLPEIGMRLNGDSRTCAGTLGEARLQSH
jgi:hypothetical protein